MKNEVLYIDGQQVDISDKGLGITLNFETNILDGLSKRKKNYTNTVKLPKTERNAAVFSRADMVSVVNGVSYQKHTARYLIGGIEVFDNGEAYLLKVSDNYEIAITFGRDPIRRLIEDNVLLSDLIGTETWEVKKEVDGDTLVSYNDPIPDIANIWHDSLKDIQLLRNANAHSLYPYNPSVSVKAILNKIASQFNFTIYTSVIDNIIANLYCLVSGKKGTDNTFEGEEGNAIFTIPESQTAIIWPLKEFSSGPTSWNNIFTVQDDGETYKSLKAKGKWKIHVSATLNFGTNRIMQNFEEQAVRCFLCDDNGLPKHELNITELRTQGDRWYLALIESDVEIDKDEAFCFYLQLPENVLVRRLDVYDGGRFNATITIPFAPEEVPFTTIDKTRTAPVYQNLPDVKIMDFFATLNAICNTFMYVVQNNGQWSAYFAKINSSSFVDWTTRLIQSEREQPYKEMTFTPNGWARHNYLEWRNGFRGDIMIDNVQLQDERTWFKSDFNLPEGFTDYAIPYYTIQDDGNIEFTKPAAFMYYVDKWRKLNVGEYYLIATRTGLDFETIITQYYSNFAAWMQHPKILTVQILLSDIDIKNIESIGRIYLAQFGAYFAPLTIQYKSGSPSKVQLLKIS